MATLLAVSIAGAVFYACHRLRRLRECANNAERALLTERRRGLWRDEHPLRAFSPSLSPPQNDESVSLEMGVLGADDRNVGRYNTINTVSTML